MFREWRFSLILTVLGKKGEGDGDNATHTKREKNKVGHLPSGDSKVTLHV